MLSDARESDSESAETGQCGHRQLLNLLPSSGGTDALC